MMPTIAPSERGGSGEGAFPGTVDSVMRGGWEDVMLAEILLLDSFGLREDVSVGDELVSVRRIVGLDSSDGVAEDMVSTSVDAIELAEGLGIVAVTDMIDTIVIGRCTNFSRVVTTLALDGPDASNTPKGLLRVVCSSDEDTS